MFLSKNQLKNQMLKMHEKINLFLKICWKFNCMELEKYSLLKIPTKFPNYFFPSVQTLMFSTIFN